MCVCVCVCLCVEGREESGHGHDTAASPSCVLLISHQPGCSSAAVASWAAAPTCICSASPFTRGVTTTDSIFALLAQANHHPTLVIFLDLEKAFELASSPHAIITALVEKGVRRKLLAWLRDYLLHRRAAPG